MHICLTEDDMVLGRSLQSALQQAGYEVVWVRRVVDAKQWVEKKRFDGVLLDIGLPDGNGMELLSYFRTCGQTLPILLITARDSLEDRLKGLNLGADDYIIKPFIVSEMLARLRAVMRRAGGWSEASEAVCTFKDLVLDDRDKTLTRAGAPVSLSKSEFALLHALMQHHNRVLTRRELEVSMSSNSDGQALGVHISNLRRKIGKGYIRTVHGIGYMLEK
jgi:two-component system response regulator QseB/two-component system response regulator BasR